MNNFPKDKKWQYLRDESVRLDQQKEEHITN